jgi:hypothetical protein
MMSRLIQKLERECRALVSAPSNAVAVHVGRIIETLQSDQLSRLLLEEASRSERAVYQDYLQEWVQAARHTGIQAQYSNLPGIKTLRAQAAFGFDLITRGVAKNQAASDVLEWVEACGNKLINKHDPPNPSQRQKIESFVSEFIDPIVHYVGDVESGHDQVLACMTAYKKRCEWFKRRRLQSEIESVTSGKGKNNEEDERGIEEILKRDFLGFLFDREVQFSIEERSPNDLKRPDVLVRFPDGSELVVEAKVFGGKGDWRDASWVQKGLEQAEHYANQFVTPFAYLLIFNLDPQASPSAILGESTQKQGDIWVVTRASLGIRTVFVNIGKNKTQSRSGDGRLAKR